MRSKVRILNEDFTKSYTHRRDITDGPRPKRNISQNRSANSSVSNSSGNKEKSSQKSKQ